MLDRDTQNVDMLVRTLDVHMLEGTLRDYARPSPKCHAATFWQLRVRFRPYIASSVSVLVSVLGTRSASNPGPLAFVFLCFVLPLRWQNWFLVIFVYHFCSPFRICFPVWVLVSIVLWHLSFVCPYVVPVSSPFFSLPLTGGVKRFVSPIRSLLVWLLLG